jgi:hypothetical protein
MKIVCPAVHKFTPNSFGYKKFDSASKASRPPTFINHSHDLNQSISPIRSLYVTFMLSNFKLPPKKFFFLTVFSSSLFVLYNTLLPDKIQPHDLLEAPPGEFFIRDGLLYYNLPQHSETVTEPSKKLGWIGNMGKLKAVHPITYLMNQAEKEWKQKLSRQSRTLEECVKEYKRRYGIDPPKGFDEWSVSVLVHPK